MATSDKRVKTSYGTTGAVLYYSIANVLNTQYYNTVGAAFEAYNAANWTDYDFAMAELGATRVWVASADFTALAADKYLVIVRVRAGGAAAVTDEIAAIEVKDWDGTQFRDPLVAATADRTLVVDAAGLADANMVKAGPTGSGTAQTAGDIIGEIGSAPSAAEVADAVWDEDATAHQTLGTFGRTIGDQGADGDSIWAYVDNISSVANSGTFGLAAIKAETALIVADSNELQTDWVNGGRLDLILDARASQTSVDAVDDIIDTEFASLVTEVSKIPKSDGTATWNATALAAIQTQAEDALVTHRLDELLNADSDIDGLAPPTVGSVFHELLSKTAGSFTFDQTTDSLEALRERGDAAWITATGFSTLDAAGVRAAVGLASANLDTQLAAIDDLIDTEVGSIKTDTGTTLPAQITALMTTAMTEGYSTDGATVSPRDALYEILQHLGEMAIVGTAKTVKKRDGTTTAASYTLNSSTAPTSITRV